MQHGRRVPEPDIARDVQLRPVAGALLDEVVRFSFRAGAQRPEVDGFGRQVNPCELFQRRGEGAHELHPPTTKLRFTARPHHRPPCSRCPVETHDDRSGLPADHEASRRSTPASIASGNAEAERTLAVGTGRR